MWAGRAHLLCWTWHFLTATELGAKAVATILSGEEVQAAEGDGAGRRGGRGEDRRMSALSPAKSFPPPTSCFPPCLTSPLVTAWVAGLSCLHARLGLATRDQRPPSCSCHRGGCGHLPQPGGRGGAGSRQHVRSWVASVVCTAFPSHRAPMPGHQWLPAVARRSMARKQRLCSVLPSEDGSPGPQ